MKTQEELKVLKEEYEALSKKLKKLSEEELDMVTGGIVLLGLKTGEVKDGLKVKDKLKLKLKVEDNLKLHVGDDTEPKL